MLEFLQRNNNWCPSGVQNRYQDQGNKLEQVSRITLVFLFKNIFWYFYAAAAVQPTPAPTNGGMTAATTTTESKLSLVASTI